MRVPGATASYPLVVVLLLTALSYFLGRVSVGKLDVPEQAPCVPCPAPARTRERALSIDYDEATRPDPHDWVVMSEASGLLHHRPPLIPGASGVAQYTIAPFQILSLYPRIIVFPNFVDKVRAQAVIRMAEGSLRRSSLAFKRGDNADNTKDVRTSQGTFLPSAGDTTGVLAWIEERIAQVTGLPASNGEDVEAHAVGKQWEQGGSAEPRANRRVMIHNPSYLMKVISSVGGAQPFNVLKYEAGQHYDSHYDVFDPASYGPQKSNRIATVLVYLEAPEEGGETIFPLEGKDGLERLSNIDYHSCEKGGYKYKPRSGDAVLFWSLTIDGKFDKHSLHGGCPVIKGTKWAATKWIRDVGRS